MLKDMLIIYRMTTFVQRQLHSSHVAVYIDRALLKKILLVFSHMYSQRYIEYNTQKLAVKQQSCVTDSAPNVCDTKKNGQ